MESATAEPCVVKADGLAAGKGVFVCQSTDEAFTAIERIMVREEFGRTAGRQIVNIRHGAGDRRQTRRTVAIDSRQRREEAARVGMERVVEQLANRRHFLQLAAEDNSQICQPSTAAQ